MLGRSWCRFISFLRCPCLPLGMFSVAVHCLMLPSQRTLQLMATIGDGNSNVAWLEAPLGVIDVLGHLCLWAGCSMRLPQSLRSPVANGGIAFQWRKQKLGKRRSPRTRLAADLASDNRARGPRLYWQVPSLVVRAGQTLAVCSGELFGLRHGEDICSDRRHGQQPQSRDDKHMDGAIWFWRVGSQTFHYSTFGPISPDIIDQSGTRTLPAAWASRGTLHIGALSFHYIFFSDMLRWRQSSIKFATFWFSSSCQRTQCLSLLPCPINHR